MRRGQIYELLAAVLRYPDAGYLARVQRCAFLLEQTDAQAARRMRDFAAHIAPMTLEDAQELFTRTFDLNPVCTLELGWHLFGEQYERGSLLVKMREELRRYGIRESSELPDHLVHALQLLARMEEERAEEFATAIVLPALFKMLPNFQGQDCPFANVMDAVWSVLHGRYPIDLTAAQEPVLRVLS